MRDRRPAPTSRVALRPIPAYAPAPPPPAGGRVARLDANESAAGPFPGVLDALAALLPESGRYPGRDLPLVEAIQRRHDVDATAIAVGNGADALIGLLCRGFVGPGDEAVMPGPSFVSFAIDTLRAGGEPVEVPTRGDGAADLDAMLAAITPRTRIAFVCTPNNPTGGALADADVDRFCAAVPPEVLVVVDHAYREYTGLEPDDVAPLDLSRPNVCYLRTFSKLFGLAGLRIGYLVGPPEVADVARRLRHWYDVGDAAHVAATMSLGQPDEIRRRRDATAEARDRLRALLGRHGLEALPSAANFLSAPVDDAVALADALAAHGVLVRAVRTPTGDLLRVTTGDDDDLDQLDAALAATRA